jgi:AcrR family transcriptional regulator
VLVVVAPKFLALARDQQERVRLIPWDIARVLEGAKRCIYEKGYARTTARDIVAASGTNLGSIGYHYGSTEALLTAAMMEAFGEWGEELGEVLAVESGGTPLERLEATWARVIATFETHRPLWIASFEAFTQAERSPELRKVLADGYEMSRPWAAALLGRDEQDAADDRAARTVGSLLLAIQAGIAAQWLLDPERSPSASDLVEGFRAVLATVEQNRA